MTRIYLDNAATSWPKPDSVYEAVDRYQRTIGVTAGRGAYREAVEVERRVLQTRSGLARLAGVADPRRVIFTLNGTDSLNLAIHGLVRPGDHVITSEADHNSTLRPLRYLEQRGVAVTRVRCDGEGFVSLEEIAAALRRPTRLIALVHASNVTGAVQPVEEVGRLAREHEAWFLLDAAQTLGHLPVALATTQADLIAAPGHKGLLGPLGTGVLLLAAEVDQQLEPLREGGTGTHSERDEQPQSLPDRYESGNLNVPGILGLGAGIAYLLDQGLATCRQREIDHVSRLLAGLQDVPGVKVYGPRDPARRVGVVSFTVDGYDPQEFAALLDASFEIQARAGLHCAPLMHAALGTTGLGGTIRLSPGPFTTETEIDAAVRAVAELTAG